MASCRLVTINEEEVTSKTWDDIRKEVGNDALADELYLKIDTPEFKKWFGNWNTSPEQSSKVVNELGEPLLLYHSSFKTFSEFDSSKSKEIGFHFGTEKAAVERNYPGGLDQFGTNVKDAREALIGEHSDFTVYPVFLNIKRIIEGVDYITADDELGKITIPMEEWKELYDLGKNKNGLSEPYAKLIIAFYQKGLITKEQAYSAERNEQSLEEMLDADGYWYTNQLEHKGEKSYVVFDPVNIKSLYNLGTYSKENADIYKQSELESSKATDKTLARFKEFAERLGLRGTYLQNMVVNGKKYTANGIADIAKGMYYILEGKQSTAEPEEIMHFAVEALEESNPKLFNQMLGKIRDYKIYKSVYDQYSRDEFYQKDGRPDIRKIKKEAIAKLLVETVIKQNEGLTEKPELLAQTLSWWEQIKQWFLSLIGKAGFNPFEEAVTQLDTLKSYEKTEQVFLQKAQDTADKIVSVAKTMTKVYQEDTSKVLASEEEANNWYEINGQKVPNRVTDRVKRWYENIPFFRNKKFTAEEEELNNVKREFGISGHNGFESIANRYFDKEGNRLEKVLDKPKVSPIHDDTNFKIYDKLETYFLGIINQHQDAKVFSEVMIYDPKYQTKKGKGEAGTIDLLIIDPDGKANIYDWKFMGNNPKQTDVAAYKQGAYDIQLSRYKDILKEQYGVKSFGKVRAVPIMMNISIKNNTASFAGIGIGSADPKEVQTIKLLPVPIMSERTNSPEVNKILDKLSALYSKVQGEKVKPEERVNKRERLEVLKDAVRKIQTQENLIPLLDSMRLHIQSFEDTLQAYTNKYKDQDLKKYSTIEVSDFAEDLNELRDLVNFYSNISVELKDIFAEDDNLFAEIVALENRIRIYEHKFFNIESRESIYNKFGEQLGAANNVLDLLRPEKIVKGLGKLFTSLEDLPNKALNLLVNLYNEAKQKAVDSTTIYNTQLFELIKKINKNHTGNAFVKLIKSDSHELISEFDPKFFKEFSETKDKKKFVSENIDLEGYKKEADKYIKEQEVKIDAEPALYTDAKQEQKRKEDRKQVVRSKFSYDSDEISNNHIIRKYINKKWQSSEFKEISKPGNEDLFEFYNKIIEINEIAYDAGYIEYKKIRTFLPFMASSLKDKFSEGNYNLPFNFLDSLSRTDQAAFGYINPVSGNKTYILPKYFTHDITRKVDKQGNITHDMSLVSKELGQSMLLYTQAIFKYKAMSEIEPQIKLVQNIEGLKKHIETNNFNNPVFNDEIGEVNILPGNRENEQLFDKFTQYLIYGNKYPLSTDSDTGLNKVANIVKRGINKTFNTKLEETSTPSSLIKTIDALNRGFQLKTLGGNLFSGLVNWFGGNIQALSQAGEYYPVKDFLKAEVKMKRLLDENAWGDKEKDTFMQLLAEFKPLSEGATYDMFKNANSSGTGRFSFSDVMMAFMRRPEILMQASVFEAIMYNTMVHEGKLVNITDFVKAKYSDRYSSAEKLKKSKDEMQAEINKLKNEKSLIKIAKVENGELKIEGLENFKEEVRKFSILTQRVYRKITGNVSDTAVNMAKLDVFTSSMMVFKNWIPKLAYTRFQKLQKVNDPIREDNYEIGRVRLLLSTLFDKQIGSVKGIIGILKGNEKGLLKLDYLYEKYAESYEKSTGQKFTMDQNDFKDMIIKNLSNEIRELTILLSITGAMFGLGFIEPPEDDDKAKSALNLLIRTLDKFKSELSFFYNPMEAEQMFSGGTFPALGLFSDISKVLTQAQREFTGYDFRDPYKESEQVREEAQPIKYTLKLVPGASAWLTWLTVFSPELAKDIDIKTPSKESRSR